MTDKELIEFGNKLIAKERTSIEIYNALLNRASDKEQLNRVLPKVVKPEAKKKKRSPEQVNVLLKAHRLKLRSDYSIQSLVRLSFVVLCVGGVVLFLSNEKVNGNAFFGWTTIIQGLSLLVLYSLVKYRGKSDLLLIGMVSYFLIWSIEILIDGIPNDLLEVYNNVRVRAPHIRQQTNVGGARFIGFIFPYLYLGVKAMLGWFVTISYLNYKKFDALPNEVKIELEDF